jgi:gentisate 1,2-dioxygenase
MNEGPTKHPAVRSDLLRLYQELSDHDMAPLWERLSVLVAKVPVTPALPALWDYDQVVRPYLMECGVLISAAEAERRVLILENPGLRGKGSVTHSLYAGLQLIMPGEVAPVHRHTQCALRFVIEGKGAYTAVNGERTIMKPGDFVLTPSWRWHDHGNETSEPMVWLDGLDIPVLGFFDASFAETSRSYAQSVKRPVDASRLEFGNNLFPIDWKAGDRNSPLINYPYERSRETLHAMVRNGAPDSAHGYKLRYVNPANGGSPMPTIGAFIQLLPAGFMSERYRATDGTVYAVVEGKGKTTIGDTVLHWKPRDIFVVPSWYWHVHEASSDAVLFSFSDRPVHQNLGFWREERSDSTWSSG